MPPLPTTTRARIESKISVSVLVVAILALAIVVIYSPTSTFPFIKFDDDIYVYNNPQVSHGLTWAGIKWAFQPNASASTYWQPITWISFMLDVEIFGINPAAHHTINWLIHLANAILLYFLFNYSTGKTWESACVSLFFAVHPLNVESVVWIAERKNVLSTFFCIASLLAYYRFTLKGTSGLYLMSLILYSLGLLSKPNLVTLPALLLLLDFWPLHRLNWPILPGPISLSSSKKRLTYFCAQNRWIFLEKIPFLALSLVSVVLTSLAVSKYAKLTVTFQAVPLSLRVENIFTSYVAYLGKLVYPTAPAFLYPFPAEISLWQVIPSALLLGIITTIALINFRKRPWLTMGWCWFLIAMLPVSGIMQVGVWPRMADHFLYLPEIGLLIICAWLLTATTEGLYTKLLPRLFITSAIIIVLTITAAKQIWYWRDSSTLLKQSLAVGGPHPFVLDNIAADLLAENRPLAALPYLHQALALDPKQSFTMAFLGTAYMMLNLQDEAISQFQHALKEAPGYKVAEDNQAYATGKKTHFTEILKSTQAALTATPDSPELLNKLGTAYFYLGQPQNAVDTLRHSLIVRPDNKDAINELGKIYLLYGKTRQSIVFFQDALRIDPDFTEARNNLLSAQKNMPEGREEFENLPGALIFK